jgi:hypothetical protein
MKITDIKTWLDKCNDACFAIQLPSGWLGRPLDNQHRLEDYIIDTNKISIKFDEGRELIIYDCANTTFEVDQNNNHLVKFSSFSKIEFGWFPYDKNITDKTTQVFKDGELILYGKYFK